MTDQYVNAYDKKDAEALEACVGKIISMVYLGHEVLTLVLEGGKVVTISDDGQSCCENRYITCDDDLTKIVGEPFRSVTCTRIDNIDDPAADAHEVAFVEVRAGIHSITLTTHNEHNGYYGGFFLRATVK